MTIKDFIYFLVTVAISLVASFFGFLSAVFFVDYTAFSKGTPLAAVIALVFTVGAFALNFKACKSAFGFKFANEDK